MKKYATGIFVMGILLFFPFMCFPAYHIILKDGTKFVTDRYWEEEDQIKFKRYGGVIGIEKERVIEIEEIEDVPAKEEMRSEKESAIVKAGTDKQKGPEKAAAKPQAPERNVTEGIERGQKNQEEPDQINEEQREEAEKTKPTKIEALLKEKREIMEERRLTSEAFQTAKANDDKEAMIRQIQQIIFLREKLIELQKRAEAVFGGKLPADWWEE